jgi:hypothetical protein
VVTEATPRRPFCSRAQSLVPTDRREGRSRHSRSRGYPGRREINGYRLGGFASSRGEEFRRIWTRVSDEERSCCGSFILNELTAPPRLRFEERHELVARTIERREPDDPIAVELVARAVGNPSIQAAVPDGSSGCRESIAGRIFPDVVNTLPWIDRQSLRQWRNSTPLPRPADLCATELFVEVDLQGP